MRYLVSLFNANGVRIANYTYDAWGNVRSITDQNGNDVSSNATHQGNINLIRYRGYYYDAELNMYWLTTRFYDPEIGRFINADTQLNEGMLGNNVYAYCCNDPVNGHDPMGTCAHNTMGFDCSSCRRAYVGSVFSQVDEKYLRKDEMGNLILEPSDDISNQLNLYDPSSGSKKEGKINVEFFANEENPYFIIFDAHLYANEADRQLILAHIMVSGYYSQEIYGRTLNSMVIEWAAHYDMYYMVGGLSPTAKRRAKDVNFDKETEGLSYQQIINKAVGWTIIPGPYL